jgi:hypothetical protein
MKRLKTLKGITNSQKQLFVMINCEWVRVSNKAAIEYFTNKINVYSKL